MNRSWLAILFSVLLGVIANGCNTAAPAPYYSSKRDLLGKPAPANTPPNSIDQRLAGAPASPTPDTTSSTNPPPRQTQ
jgi:hypothetical protein